MIAKEFLLEVETFGSESEKEARTMSALLFEEEKERVFEALVKRNRQRAYWMAYDILQNAQEAEDLSQEAFLRAYEKWDDFRGEASRDTWMLRILINLCLSHRRRRGLWMRIADWLQGESQETQLLGGQSLMKDAEKSMIDRSTAERIREAMARLPEGQRVAFALRYLHEMSIQEIAEATHSATGTIKSHLFRALRAMRGHLEELGITRES